MSDFNQTFNYPLEPGSPVSRVERILLTTIAAEDLERRGKRNSATFNRKALESFNWPESAVSKITAIITGRLGPLPCCQR